MLTFFRAYVTGDGSVGGTLTVLRGTMAVRYKIMATITKPGGMPVQWTRYSREKMTQAECEKMFTSPGTPGKTYVHRPKVENFRCDIVR